MPRAGLCFQAPANVAEQYESGKKKLFPLHKQKNGPVGRRTFTLFGNFYVTYFLSICISVIRFNKVEYGGKTHLAHHGCVVDVAVPGCCEMIVPHLVHQPVPEVQVVDD